MRERLAVSASIILLTLLSFSFPGRSYLGSDTQIYVPMLEHLFDPTVLANDPMATRPHVSFTLYDEMALLLRRLGLPFQYALQAQQIIFRALALLGVFWIASAARLGTVASLCVAALYGLGATITGPAVLTVEYEPVPRGFALALVLLALGLIAQGRVMAGAIAGAAGTLYHLPATYAFWLVFLYLVIRNSPGLFWKSLIPVVAAVVLLGVTALLQIGPREPQMLIGRIDSELETLQRMRASYNWVTVWLGQWWQHYTFLLAFSMAAFMRVRKHLPDTFRPFAVGMPLVGAVGLGLSYFLLERMKWIAMPQFQPGRALLFVTLFAILLGSIAAFHAVRLWSLEAVFWLVIVIAIPVQNRISEILPPNPRVFILVDRFKLTLALALLGALGIALLRRHRLAAGAVLAVFAITPYFAIPGYGKVINFRPTRLPEILEVSRWARDHAPPDAVFLFPQAGQDLAPGVFRAESKRTVYVDWKAGGQVNYSKRFADIWWERWNATMQPGYKPENLGLYGQRGITHLVLKAGTFPPGLQPIFSNRLYSVFRIAGP